MHLYSIRDLVFIEIARVLYVVEYHNVMIFELSTEEQRCSCRCSDCSGDSTTSSDPKAVSFIKAETIYQVQSVS